MKYNLLKNSYCSVNTSDGNKIVDDTYLQYLSDFGSVAVATLSGTDVLSVEFDLGYRMYISDIEYKFEGFTTPILTATGISFYYKNDSYDSYTELPTLCSGTWLFGPSLSGIAAFSPRYIKCVHNIHTSNSGIVYGFKAYNNDAIVDFGTTGQLTGEAVDIIKGGEPEIREIPVYNNGSKSADAFINIEPTYTDLDYMIGISDSAEGPWLYIMDTTQMIYSSSNFNYGANNTAVSSQNGIMIVGGYTSDGSYVTKYDYGTYITKVTKTVSSNYYNRLLLGLSNNSIGSITKDSYDSIQTVEIKVSNNKPKAYAYIRTLYNVLSSTYNLVYKDYWLNTLSDKETGTYIIGSATGLTPWNSYGIVFDNDTEYWGCWAECDGTDYRSSAYLYIFMNYQNTGLYYKLLALNSTNAPVNYSFREMQLDKYGGMWIYLYCQSYRTSDFVDATGYYLAYFDNSLNNTFKWFTSNEEIGNISIVYDTRDVWFTKTTSDSIYRIGIDGTFAIEFSDADYTTDLGGIASLSDGSIYFSNGSDIHHLKYNGAIIEDDSMYDICSDSVSYIAIDGDGSEAIWVIFGLNVGRLFVSGEHKGEFDFIVDNIGYPVRLKPTEEGVAVKCSDSDVSGTSVLRYISKENRKVDVNYVVGSDSLPCIVYQSYDNINYTARMPYVNDTVWSNLSWKKISTCNYMLPEDSYYQLRLTLRRDKPYKAWPTATSDASATYVYNDYFNQSTIVPNKLMWSTWYNYPANDYVYVNTISGCLTLKSGGTSNSYIDSIGRTAYTFGSTGTIEIIAGYKIGSGNGTNTGKAEFVYLTLESIAQGVINTRAQAAVSVSSSPVNNNALVYVYRVLNGSSSATSSALGTGLNNYEGELKIVIDSAAGYLYSGWRSTSTGTWTMTSQTTLAYSSLSMGSYFRLKLSGYSAGSNVNIDYVYMNYGTPCYYVPSPIIETISEQSSLMIEDVNPGSSKSVFVKLEADEDFNGSSTNDIELRAMWKVPV